MAKRDINPTTTIFVATVWWRDCDPMFSILATTAKRCEKEAYKSMREEAKRAADESWDCGRKYAKTVRECAEDVCWSGVHPFAVSDLVREREMREVLQDLNDNGVAYLSV